MTKRNIEKYIKTLKGRIDSNRISVVLYDEGYDIYHYIYRIRMVLCQENGQVK